jgi:diguanylate cyclase (GGDEF)-like protein
MIPPATPLNEAHRLDTLRALHILDTSPEERFDRLTRLAKRLFGVPIALVSLVDADRQWFKSCQGLPDQVTETPRDVSFCGHAILSDDILLVPDALADPRFHDNPLVVGNPKIRFYAGCPLSVPNGSKLGTLCIIDVEPRSLEESERALLHDLARMAEQEIAAVQLATMDDLTLMSNRRGFRAIAQHALGLCARFDRPASLMFFDLDDFKSINDRFGHAEGDRALVAFGKLLQKTFRETDVVGRLGGDEFVALISSARDAECKIAEKRLQTAVEKYNRKSKRGYDIRFSVGSVAYQPIRHSSIDAMLADADELMYKRKQRRHAA